MTSFNALHTAAIDKAARGRQFQSLNAYDRHKRMVHELVTYYGGTIPNQLPEGSSTIKTDYDVLKEGYRFIRTDADDAAKDGDGEASWEIRLAKRYYSRLFKEYAIADLSMYKEGKLGLRWRTQKEVVQGKGQFICGATQCDERRGLESFEVPFGYKEAGEKKQALVKVRVCPTHAYQLNYKKHHQAATARNDDDKKKKRKKKSAAQHKKKKKKRRTSSHRSDETGEETSSSSSSSSSSEEEEEEDVQQQKSSSKKSRQATDGGDESFDEFFDGLFE